MILSKVIKKHFNQISQFLYQGDCPECGHTTRQLLNSSNQVHAFKCDECATPIASTHITQVNPALFILEEIIHVYSEDILDQRYFEIMNKQLLTIDSLPVDYIRHLIKENDWKWDENLSISLAELLGNFLDDVFDFLHRDFDVLVKEHD